MEEEAAEAGVVEAEQGSILSPSMQQSYYRSLRDKKIQPTSKLKKGGWLRIEDPTPDVLEQLIQEHALEESIVNDGMDPFEIPRIEYEEGILYCILRLPSTDTKKSLTQPVLIAVTPDSVITICKHTVAQFDTLLKHSASPIITTQKYKFLLQLLLVTVKEYEKIILKISKEVSFYSEALESIDNTHIAKLVKSETQYNTYLGVLNPLKMVVEKIRTSKQIVLHEADHDLLEDLVWSLDQLIHMSVFGIKQVTNVREAFSTIISNNLNKTLKILTSVTVILTIPTIVSSFFGMNVIVPLENSWFGFGLIAAVTAIASSLLYYVFRKKDLL